MSQEDVEVVRRGIDAWNQREAEAWRAYARQRSSGFLVLPQL